MSESAWSGYPPIEERDAEIERLRKSLNDHLESEAAETRRADRERDRARTAEAEIERLRSLLADAPCTCENPPPYDWPHDPTNQECYLTRAREALGE